ncbi:hypothetical protein LX32DRAFT_667788 [Colletotrichum zoysiae]|uniref:ORC1/DEAH AAA+ ATPase domain-containing protein n=1 Tax=Colletotrichum zoysiae TaxID=1216348 RepID=A0AAD9H5V5_9PEZI|nr:hypothetical protein LX32DRAFT_667788 [Colletotrichum zoysiae]
MEGQSFGSTTGHIAFPGARVETGGTLNVTVTDSPTVTPPLFVVPFEQNSYIIDRPDLFIKLDDLLPRVADYQSAALWGLGGSGKTQIALEFAYRRFRETGCSVYWVHADNEATFAQDYEKTASKAGLAGKFQGKELLRAIREWIETQPRWLLIIDNADNLSIFGVGKGPVNTTQSTADETCLNDYIPGAPVGTVLWTSRDQQIVGSLVGARRGVPVGRTTVYEATELFCVTRNEIVAVEEIDAVSELLDQLDHLPLAVSQAAAYIRRRPTPVAEYLSRLKEGKERWRVLQKSEHDRHRRREVPNSILETWTISMEHIRQEDDTAYRILLTLPYVHNQNIPDSLIRAAARPDIEEDMQNLEITSSSTESEDESDDDSGLSTRVKNIETGKVAKIVIFPIISVDVRPDASTTGRTYDMHKLFQDAARYSLSQKSRRQEAAQYSEAALLLVSELFLPISPETWDENEMWLPHALQNSDWAENILGTKHPDIIQSMTSLAVTYIRQGKYSEAKNIMLEVLILRQEVLGKAHPSPIRFMEDLAVLYWRQGRYDKEAMVRKETEELLQTRMEA